MICHACGAEEGMLHELGCGVERCPFCLRQLISCDCSYKILGIDASEGTWAYQHGLNKRQQLQWERTLNRKGRIPHVEEPLICDICGQLWPQFFMVTNSQWRKYIIPTLQRKVLCRSCYDIQVHLFPNGWRKAKQHHCIPYDILRSATMFKFTYSLE